MLFDLSHEKMVFIGFMFVLTDVIFLIHRFVLLSVMLMLIQAEFLLQALVYIKEKAVRRHTQEDHPLIQLFQVSHANF